MVLTTMGMVMGRYIGWIFERDNDAYHTYYDGFGTHGTGAPALLQEKGIMRRADDPTVPLPLRVGVFIYRRYRLLRLSPMVQIWVLLVLLWLLAH